MKKLLTVMALSLMAVFVVGGVASAHFQMVYTPNAFMDKGQEIPLALVFSHPFDAGHTMDMGQPQEFYVVHKGKKKDLMKTLQPIEWASLTNKGKAYKSKYKMRGMGDWVFVLVPEPYYEKNEDCYIQQLTKMMVNAAGVPTDWDQELGLPAEIVPLAKPYALWTGNVFQGVVKGNGKPVPFAEVEVEYLNHPPVPGKNMFQKKALVNAPQDAFVTATLKADANGVFTYAIPKAGWWGFAALGVGPQDKYKGKENSQDAVIWVEAVDMK